MYTYNLRSTGGTTSSTANQWQGPYFSVRPGTRAIRIRGVKFDIGTQLYLLMVRRGCTATTIGTGSVVTPYQLTLDTTPTPQFSAIWSSSGIQLVRTQSLTDEEVFYMAGGSIGQTEWTDGDITNMALPAYDPGSLDVYVASPNASASFNLNVIVEENPWQGRYDLAGATTSAIKSGIIRRR